MKPSTPSNLTSKLLRSVPFLVIFPWVLADPNAMLKNSLDEKLLSHYRMESVIYLHTLLPMDGEFVEAFRHEVQLQKSLGSAIAHQLNDGSLDILVEAMVRGTERTIQAGYASLDRSKKKSLSTANIKNLSDFQLKASQLQSYHEQLNAALLRSGALTDELNDQQMQVQLMSILFYRQEIGDGLGLVQKDYRLVLQGLIVSFERNMQKLEDQFKWDSTVSQRLKDISKQFQNLIPQLYEVDSKARPYTVMRLVEEIISDLALIQQATNGKDDERRFQHLNDFEPDDVNPNSLEKDELPKVPRGFTWDELQNAS